MKNQEFFLRVRINGKITEMSGLLNSCNHNMRQPIRQKPRTSLEQIGIIEYEKDGLPVITITLDIDSSREMSVKEIEVERQR